MTPARINNSHRRWAEAAAWLRTWGPVIGWIVVLCVVGIIGGTI
jgi:hypothetical protein